MNRTLLAAAAVASFATVPATAHAEKRISVMVEPIYLVLPMIDATVEVEVTPHIGIAAIAGYARIMFGASLYDLGGQANIYVRESFQGWHVGSELRAMWGDSGPLLSYGSNSDDKMSSSGHDRIAGVYGGYKWMRPHGFTAVLQVGVGRYDMSGTSQDPPASKVLPVANFNLGYSW